MERSFKFSSDLTLAQNFHKWYNMDCDERHDWGEPRLEYLEGIRRFAMLHSVAAVDIQDSLDAERKRFSFMPEKG